MSTFNFPNGIDVFEPELINDLTVVNATHVNDLRMAIVEIENALVGITTIPYTGTDIVLTTDNIKAAIEKLDQHVRAIEAELLLQGDGYGSRLDSLEDQLQAHRSSSGPIDDDGYAVHNVDGYIVGTENEQALLNKTVDSGTVHAGPKFVARAGFADSGLRQIEVYNTSNQLSFWVDEQGNAYFAGDLTVLGDELIEDIQHVQSHLIVDGYSILGNNAGLDTTTINGNVTINGSDVQINSTSNLNYEGANAAFGDGSGTFTMDFTNTEASGNFTVLGNLAINGSIVLGDGSGSDSVTVQANVSIYQGLTVSGTTRLLGDLWFGDSMVNDDVVFTVDNFTANATTLILNSTTITLTASTINLDGDISSDGATYVFGNAGTSATNTFTINAQTFLAESLNVGDDLDVVGSGTFGGDLTVDGALTVDGNVILGSGANLLVANMSSSTFNGDGAFTGSLSVGESSTFGASALDTHDFTGDVTADGYLYVTRNVQIGGGFTNTIYVEASSDHGGITLWENGDVELDGKLTVKGPIDPISVEIFANVSVRPFPLIINDSPTGAGTDIFRVDTLGNTTLTGDLVAVNGNFTGDLSVSGTVTGVVIDLTTDVVGILPIANGGTNSSTALANDRLIISSSGSIVEHSALTGSRALVSNVSGLPTTSTVTTTELGYVSGVTSSIQSQIDSKVNTSLVGAPSGVASLDVGGKVPIAQLPNAIMEYQGNWDASTNTPPLADGYGNADEDVGDVYRVSEDGYVDFGSGGIQFYIGDYAILNANKVWERAETTSGVISVQGLQGIVTLNTDNIPEGSSNFYLVGTELSNVVEDLTPQLGADLDLNTFDLNNGSTTVGRMIGSYVSIGEAATSATSGSNAVLIGQSAGGGITGAVPQSSVFIGWRAGNSDITGTSNILIGREAGDGLTSGASNVLVGYRTGRLLTTSSSNVILGTSAMELGNNTPGNTVIGNNAGTNYVGAGQMTVAGSNSGRYAANNNAGQGPVYIGISAGFKNAGNHNVGVGYSALLGAPGTTGVPAESLTASDSGGDLLFTRGSAHGLIDDDRVQMRTTNTLPTGVNLTTAYFVVSSTATTFKISLTSGGAAITFTDAGVGTHSAYTAYGSFNTAVGALSMIKPTTGGSNTALGYQTLNDLTTGSSNVAVGFNSLLNVTTGGNNVAVGANALDVLTTGIDNVAVGLSALGSLATNSQNTAVGRQAGEGVTGAGSVFFGYQAGNALTTGTNSVFLGRESDSSLVSATNAIAIGYQATVDTSNKIRFGNSSLADAEWAGGIVHHTPDSTATGDFTVKTGDASAGNSGDVVLDTGTATGTRGAIRLLGGTEGTAGHVWTSTGTAGEGSWAVPPGGWVSSIQTTTYNANSGDEIFADTDTVGAFTITLPATPILGNRVRIVDARGTWATNNVTVDRNSENINGDASDLTLDIDDAAVELVYMDGTEGWKIVVN